MKCIIIQEITDEILDLLNKSGTRFSVENHHSYCDHSNVYNPKSCEELVKNIGFVGITTEGGRLVNNNAASSVGPHTHSHHTHTSHTHTSHTHIESINETPYSVYEDPHKHEKYNHRDIFTCLDALEKIRRQGTHVKCSYPLCDKCMTKDQIRPIEWR